METITLRSKKGLGLRIPARLNRQGLVKISEQIQRGIFLKERETLTDAVTKLGDREQFATLIDCIANDKNLFQKTRENSYRHHNGFHKIVLHATELFKLRLHIFKEIPGVPVPMENIHNHRWNFASRIMTGNLTMELFTESEAGEIEVNNYSYKATNITHTYGVKYAGTIRLQRLSQIKYNAGCTYYMTSQELHRIINPEQVETQTLMITGFPTSQICKLYSQHQFEGNKQDVEVYTTNELLAIFQAAITV